MTEEHASQDYGGYYVAPQATSQGQEDPARLLYRKLRVVAWFIVLLTLWGLLLAMAISAIFFGYRYPWYWWVIVLLVYGSVDIDKGKKKDGQ